MWELRGVVECAAASQGMEHMISVEWFAAVCVCTCLVPVARDAAPILN